MLEINNVTKRYIGVTAVKDATLRLEDGRLAALLGPNGSGKTTLMKMIAGLTKPDGGSILFDGVPCGVESKKHVCYMPTENYFYSYMTVRDVGRYFADFFEDFSIPRFEEMLSREDLAEKRKVRALSSGMMAKVKLAAAFARQSRLTMLDEPLNGIDILARERTIRLIEENRGDGRAMIVSSHLVDELEPMIDTLIFMRNGEIVLCGDKETICSERGKTVVELYREIYGGEAQADV